MEEGESGGIGTGMGNTTGVVGVASAVSEAGRNNYFAGRSLGAPSRDHP